MSGGRTVDRYKYLEKTSTYSASSFHLPVSATSNKQAASLWSGCRKSFSMPRLYNSCRRYGCGHGRINCLCPRERSAINDLRLAASERQGERQEETWCNRLESGNLGNSHEFGRNGDGVRSRVATSRDKRRRPASISNPFCILSPVEHCLGLRSVEPYRRIRRKWEAIDQILCLERVLFFCGWFGWMVIGFGKSGFEGDSF